jgi:type II secretory ATPase GspE/PulE/Tfp pilus assembly ATPase PilB-like protein
MSQRLVRQLCPYCKKQLTPTPQQLARMGEAGAKLTRLYAPVGCQRCLGTGYAGRRAIFELLRTTEKLREVILHSPSVADLQNALAGSRFARLLHSGYELVAQGITSMEEVERLMGGDAHAGVE